MVLHDVSDNADIVEVSSAALCAERLFEGDLDALDTVFVPGGVQKLVTEPQRDQVFDQLLSEVVVDSEELVLSEQWREIALQFAG